MSNVDVAPGLRQDSFGVESPYLGRDGGRTPMQWSSRRNAGFTEGTPWLPVAPDFRSLNVGSPLRAAGFVAEPLQTPAASAKA